MNERIRELAEQADLCFVNHEGRLTSHFENFADMDNEVKKFAELIVGECANVVADAVDHREPASTYVDKIKQHFGVEE